MYQRVSTLKTNKKRSNKECTHQSQGGTASWESITPSLPVDGGPLSLGIDPASMALAMGGWCVHCSFGPCFWDLGAVGGTQDNFWKNNALVPAQEYNWNLPCIGTKPVWPNKRWKVEIGQQKDSRYVKVGSGLKIELEGLMHSPSPKNEPHKVYVMHDQQMLLLEILREGVAW